MTKEEFISTLTAKHTVKFGEGQVGSHAWLACGAIANDLGEALPSWERVLHGIQLSDFDREEKWSGKISWVLLLTTTLLELTMEMTMVEKEQVFKVSQIFHPSHRLIKVRLDVQHREAMRDRPYTVPYQASLALDFGGGVTLSIGPVKAELARQFMSALLDASRAPEPT
jgi:hypothetical protein